MLNIFSFRLILAFLVLGPGVVLHASTAKALFKGLQVTPIDPTHKLYPQLQKASVRMFEDRRRHHKLREIVKKWQGVGRLINLGDDVHAEIHEMLSLRFEDQSTPRVNGGLRRYYLVTDPEDRVKHLAAWSDSTGATYLIAGPKNSLNSERTLSALLFHELFTVTAKPFGFSDFMRVAKAESSGCWKQPESSSVFVQSMVKYVGVLRHEIPISPTIFHRADPEVQHVASLSEKNCVLALLTFSERLLKLPIWKDSDFKGAKCSSGEEIKEIIRNSWCMGFTFLEWLSSFSPLGGPKGRGSGA